MHHNTLNVGRIRNDKLLYQGRFSNPNPNFGAFIDYSTSPQFYDRLSPFLISDVTDTLLHFYSYPDIIGIRTTQFYSIFPLHDIIAMLLSVSAEDVIPGFDEYLMFMTEAQLKEKMDLIDVDGLFLFYEDLTKAVETEIAYKSPDYNGQIDYVFYDWTDPVSICLCNHRMAPRQVIVEHQLDNSRPSFNRRSFINRADLFR